MESLKAKVKIPLIFIDSYSENTDILSVNINNFKDGYLSTKYLIDNGHANIAFVSPGINKSEVIANRFKGYCKALSGSNIF